MEIDGPRLAAFEGPKVVISQVYGAGGNSGALLKNDYVELYNAGSVAATLNGTTLQYASATGTGPFANGMVALSGTVQPGGYFLVQLAGGSNGSALPVSADLASSAINMAGAAGKIALVASTTGLACNGSSTPCSAAQQAQIMDLVGFGNANYYEGSGPAAAPSTTRATFRKLDGDQDTDDNAADFTAAAPAPRNSLTTPVVIGPLDALTLPATLTVDEEATVTLTATATDAAGLAVAGGTVAWSADNENVTVTSTGARTATVRGDALGNAIVTATLTVDGITRTTSTAVTVQTPPPPGAAARVDVTNYPPTALPVGFSFPLFATVWDAANITIPTAARNWTSNQPAIATVDPVTGIVSAHGIGRAYIVAEPAPGLRDSVYVDVADVAEATTARYANHLEFGQPVDATPADDYLVTWPQFAASWNRNRGQSNWVAYNLEATHRGEAERCDCFTPDPTLPSDFPQVVHSDYTGSGYSRGHMTMSEDRTAGGSRTTTSLDNARTFYMTNIIPQTAANNGGPWLRLETYLGDLATNGNKEVFIVAGGAKYEGTLARSNGKVAAPTWTWKVAVVLPRDHGLGDVDGLGDAEIIAVSMPNTATMPSGNWQDYRVTVDSVESLTGYDVLALLPDPLEQIIESGDRAPTARIVADGGAEGEVLTFDGSASSDPDIGGALQDALSYEWIVNGHVTGTGSTVSGSFPDNGTVQVQLVVTDRFGWADTASTTVQVTNVAPTVAAIGGATLLAGENYSASGSFSDAGSADTWTATASYGDGTPAQPLPLAGNAFTLSHRYATAGTYTVTVTVTDDDRASGTRSTTVTVHSSLQGIANLQPIVDALGVAGDLNAGTLQSLRAKLNAAAASLRRGDASAASGQLNAFINELEALANSGRISAEAAASVAGYANRVIRSIAP
jgi:DNA/RNA endonuclease G (NUC1)